MKSKQLSKDDKFKSAGAKQPPRTPDALLIGGDSLAAGYITIFKDASVLSDSLTGQSMLTAASTGCTTPLTRSASSRLLRHL